MTTKAKKSKASAADDAKAQVDKRHAELRDKWRGHNRTETQAQVTDPDGNTIDLRTVAGRLYVEASGEVVLDQNGVIDLRRHLDTAFQAVS